MIVFLIVIRTLFKCAQYVFKPLDQSILVNKSLIINTNFEILFLSLLYKFIYKDTQFIMYISFGFSKLAIIDIVFNFLFLLNDKLFIQVNFKKTKQLKPIKSSEKSKFDLKLTCVECELSNFNAFIVSNKNGCIATRIDKCKVILLLQKFHRFSIYDLLVLCAFKTVNKKIFFVC